MRKTYPGRSFPLGTRVTPGGVNFSVYSRSSTALDLLLYDSVDDPQPAEVIHLDPQTNRTYHFWHIFVLGLKAGQVYAYRANGPDDPASGLRFDSSKVLLDPYARAIAFPDKYDRGAACLPGDNTPYAMKSVVVDPSKYDWKGDLPLHRPFTHTVIYEMHAGGFHPHPKLRPPPAEARHLRRAGGENPVSERPGRHGCRAAAGLRFRSAGRPIRQDQLLGLLADRLLCPPPLLQFAHHPLGVIDDFRDMVKALHRAGIEVILDVVYNHTTEGGNGGPTFNFRGLENDTYYILEADKTYYANYTGTGNTLNTNHPIVRRMILDSLRYWVAEMHVDGFRFDLASILSRDENGMPLADPPTLLDIENDPYLAGTKLIAEAWDAGGLYQVGSFIGDRWKEWNGKFRDDMRRWVQGRRRHN